MRRLRHLMRCLRGWRQGHITTYELRREADYTVRMWMLRFL